ncbi:MAG: exonuclease SbcCD subunit D [Thermoplasma acidophilum]|nr:exonuclease SbcCD subunit D [Thermoplasma acidophilum]
MPRFMHFSDTHIGYRSLTLDEREQDFYDAFHEAIDIALENSVDFVIHTGDLFDTWVPGNRAIREFRNAVMKLNARNIPIFVIFGDHDRPRRNGEPAAGIFDFMGVHVLGWDAYEYAVRKFDGEDVLIGGISNMKGYMKTRLKDEYKRSENIEEGYRNRILMSHQAIDPFFVPDQCEAKMDDLPMNFSYIAMGHLHDFMERRIGPLISYAGSTEIKSENEINGYLKQGKGVNIVDISNGEVDLQRIRLKSVRPQIRVESDADNYVHEISEKLSSLRVKDNEKKPLVGLEIHGDISMETVMQDISKFDNAIFSRPKIRKDPKIPNIHTETADLREYFRTYLGDERLADLAMKIMAHSRSKDIDGIMKEIEVLYGDNRQDSPD